MSHTDCTTISEELDALKKIREQESTILEHVKAKMLKHILDSKNWKVTSQLKEFFDYFNSHRGFDFLLSNFMGEK